ncbi:ubiquinone biosynthesis O-methyltransferase, mitochondrial-like [Brevipalpus obovatus]|uniref:ubiquinone biosynthesis O-methyltransferase, mitochondrial-like n=1 Tax=Brevipalpus obovatus TaxID=246614 RepID=UPI003D9E07A3
MSIQRRCLHLASGPLRAASGNVFGTRRVEWWSDPKNKPLRSMNQLRVPLIRDNLLAGKPINNDKPLSGLKILDVGCGGGLLSEPLARLGANVTGIDASEFSIDAAKDHLNSYSSSLKSHIEYFATEIGEFGTKNAGSFDSVVASEVVEHVDDLEPFIQSCASALKPNGSIIITTINQTLTAYMLDIILAEKVFQMLPEGTHQYELFISPNSLSLLLEKNGFTVKSIQGMVYNPLSSRWSWTSCTVNNYALVAFKNEVREPKSSV